MINEILLVLGVIFVIGAYRRWTWLVDPPIEWSVIYSQAAIRRRCGKTFTVYFTYFLGFVFAIFGGMQSYRIHGAAILRLICSSCAK
jgi:hypothetical protein